MNPEIYADLALTDQPMETAGFREAVVSGLLSNPKTLPCKYLYDAAGSRLFEQICELEQYYLTRTERQILEQHIHEISLLCGPDCLLLELGSGSSIKTRLLLNNLAVPAAYVPIDIAHEQLEQTASELREEYPRLEILPVCADYHGPFQIPVPTKHPRRTIIFFPGSTIGNLEPDQAEKFLRRLGTSGRPGGGLLVGVDLHKPREVLEAAYNDAQGVTAAFNLNLLRRINRDLDADFDLDAFGHRAVYNEQDSRIEMHLMSLALQTVQVDGHEILLAPGECIITEHSYKYSVESFCDLVARAGLETAQVWTDPLRWFAVFYLQSAPGLDPTAKPTSELDSSRPGR